MQRKAEQKVSARLIMRTRLKCTRVNLLANTLPLFNRPFFAGKVTNISLCRSSIACYNDTQGAWNVRKQLLFNDELSFEDLSVKNIWLIAMPLPQRNVKTICM
jgi:hypothetical protein